MYIGAAVMSNGLEPYREELFSLPVIEVEDALVPGFLDDPGSGIERVNSALEDYKGQIIASGPFIDLNPGSPEPLSADVTRRRYRQTYDFARAIRATEIVFLSSFIPIINKSTYDEDWVSRSIAFWRDYMHGIDSGVTVSLCNTFENFPDYLVRIAEAVDRPNFRLAVDLGHCLVYAETAMGRWAGLAGPHTTTVYVHSNDGETDLHEPPFRGELGGRRYLELALPHLRDDVKLIAKMDDKRAIPASVDWIEARVAGKRMLTG